MPLSTTLQPRWLRLSIWIGAGCFIAALLLSAAFDPRIRVLHTLQALIYVAVIALTRRNSAWGFGAGCLIAAVWNYANLFVTTFFAAGIRELGRWVETGRLERPDLLVAVIATGGHFLLLVACLVGFLRTRPRARSWLQFAAGGVLAVGYFVAILVTTGPQYIGVLKRVVGA
jgi:hypothetical protein